MQRRTYAALLTTLLLLRPDVGLAQSYVLHRLLETNINHGGSATPVPGEKYLNVGGLQAGDDEVWFGATTYPSLVRLAVRFTGTTEELPLPPGAPAPGLVGETVTNTRLQLANRWGVAYVRAELASGGDAFYRIDGATFTLFDPLVDPAPAPLPGTLIERTARCMDHVGGIFFAARYDDGGVQTTALVHQAGPGVPATLVTAEGAPAPGTAGTFGDFFGPWWYCDASESGDLSFAIGIAGAPGVTLGVFWRSADGSTLAKVIAEGDPRPDGGNFGPQIFWSAPNDDVIGLYDPAAPGNRAYAAGFDANGLPCCIRKVVPDGTPAPPEIPAGGTVVGADLPHSGAAGELLVPSVTTSFLEWALLVDRLGDLSVVATANTPVVGGLPQAQLGLQPGEVAGGPAGHVWFVAFYDQDGDGLFWAQRVKEAPSLSGPTLGLLAGLLGLVACGALRATRPRD